MNYKMLKVKVVVEFEYDVVPSEEDTVDSILEYFVQNAGRINGWSIMPEKNKPITWNDSIVKQVIVGVNPEE